MKASERRPQLLLLTALSLTPCDSPPDSAMSLRRVVFSGRSSEEKTSPKGQMQKHMFSGSRNPDPMTA